MCRGEEGGEGKRKRNQRGDVELGVGVANIRQRRGLEEKDVVG